MKIRFTIWVFLFAAAWAQAQSYKISDKPDEFIRDVTTLMAGTKNAEATRAGKEFEAVWGSSLEAGSREQIIAIGRKMAAKRYRALPQFKHFLEAVTYAVNREHLSAAQLTKFLTVADKVIDQYDSKQTTKFLEISKAFFEKKALYATNYNRLYAMGGTYSFEFKGEAAPVQEQAPAGEKQEGESKPGESKSNDGWFNDWDREPSAPALDSAAGPSQATADMMFSKAIAPTVMGAVLVLQNVNLVFATAHDSVQLAGTGGSLMLKDGIFVGNGGKFDWSMAGLPDVYCQFKTYFFDIKNPRLTSDDVVLHYSQKIGEPAPGVFEFSSKKHSSPETAQYPRFMSLYSNISIKDLGQNLVYKGGFSMVGKRTYSTSLSNRYCSLDYVVDGQAKFRTKGRKYEFGDSMITAPLVSITIPLKRDSLYHPAVRFTYNKKLPMLRLNKDEGGFQNTPYINSFHKVDINIDGLQWNPKTSDINMYILGARKEVPAVFESHDFYESTRYVQLKGTYNFHPLQILMAYSKKVNSFSFYADDLAREYKLNPVVFRGAMLRMAQHGFVTFEPESGLVKMNRKGDHNTYASNKKRDYDSFRMESRITSQANATLDLSSNVLTVRGIDRFPLSEKLQVYVIPRKKEIQLLKDRNFLLEGEVQAGNFRFKGSGFSFLYDEFTVEMNQIDTILFTPQESKGKGDKGQLGAEIRYSAGTLYVNKPDNKAGLKDFPEYPRLNVQSGAAIYFDQNDRARGAYNRNVRFEIPTVNVDSLNAKDPQYKGVFYSDGIFPAFEESLVPMSDNTLGFRHKVPKGSYNLYGTDSKMTFTSDLVMDMRGLRASGKIEHLSTTLSAKDILITPDSIIAKGAEANIKQATIGEGIYPQVNVKNFKLDWRAKVDSMIIANTTSPFEIYKETGAVFNGSVVVRKTGLFGQGTFDRKDSEINSMAYKFEPTKFSAGDAEFKIKSNVKTKPALFANFVNLDFDMAKGLANIKTSDNPQLVGFASLEFPYAAYKTSINKATWLLDKKLVLMEGDVATSTFTATNPEQEELSFNARVAGYNIDKMTLSISGIPFIRSGDAKIFPSKGVVMITENGAMQPLAKAQLTMDTTAAYHNLFDGTIEIQSRSKFSGDATYKYTNFDGKDFAVKLGNFETRELAPEKKRDKMLRYTAATGEITEEDKFFISSRVLFKGMLTMHSYRKELDLDGFIRLDLKSQANQGTWIPYKSAQGDANVAINVDENLRDGEQQLTTGLHVDKTTSSIYTTFLSPKHNPDDKDMFRAQGLLMYNANINEFKITAPERKNGNYEGNQFILDDGKGKVELEGRLDFFNSVQNEYVFGAGRCIVDLSASTYNFNTLLGFNFPVAQPILDNMANGIIDGIEGTGNSEATSDKEALYSKIAQVAGENAAKSYKSKSGGKYVPLTDASRHFLTTLVLSNVDLKWHEGDKTFYSTGKIGVSNIGKTDINAQLDGMVEIRKFPSGDQVTIYLEVNASQWYYFNYQGDKLSIVGADEAFNGLVAGKGKAGKAGQYGVGPATAEERNQFKEQFNAIYNGVIAAKTPEVKKDEKPVVQKQAEQQVEQKQAEPSDGEQQNPEPPKAEPKKGKQKKSEQKKAEPQQAEPKQVEPKREVNTEEKKDGF
ncbi:MAG TPA: hypothetical protein VF646_01950 [Cytophagales bacterium]